MSIDAIRLHNFRGFHDARIELKPLTVLLGPNSAGKSSFGHALAVMSHAHRIFAGTPQATLTPPANDAKNWPVDLGELDDLRTHGADGPVTIELETGAGLVKFGFGLDSVPGLLPSYFLLPKGEESGGQKIDASHVTNSYQQSGTTFVAETGSVERQVTKAGEHDRWYEVRRINQSQWQEAGITSIVILDGLLLNAVTHEAGTSRLLSGTAQDDIKFLFDSLAYLRATRERPSRTYRQDVGTPQSIGYSGEWTATILHRRGKESVVYAELPEIPNTVDEAKAVAGKRALLKTDTLLAAVRLWLGRLRLASAVESQPSKRDNKGLEILINLPDQQAHNIIDVGFGMSQVLPVLVCGLLQPSRSLFIVDLPEAHLHPRPQSVLADFFCSLALSGRFSLVETHSEMFFHQLRLRAEMDEELKKNIAVYFIDEPKDGECQKPRPVGLTFDEQLRWPVGFLQEAWELEAQIEAVRQARTSGRK